MSEKLKRAQAIQIQLRMQAEAAPMSMQDRVAAARAGTLEMNPTSVAGAQAATDVASAMMGQPSTPTGEAQAALEASPMSGFQAVRSDETPVIGGWSDEIAGLGEYLFGGDYEQGRQRFSEMARLYREQNPEGANRAKLLGGIEGTIAAVGPAVTGAAGAAGGILYNTAKGAVQGAGFGALEGASDAAGRAERGERGQAAIEGGKEGALFGAMAGGAVNFGTAALGRGVKSIINRSVKRPSVEALKGAKRAAYKAVDQAGDTFNASEVRGMVKQFEDALDAADFVEGMGGKADTWLARLRKTAERNQPLTLSRLDDIRSNIFKAYKAAPDEVELLDAIKAIDDLIDTKSSTSDLLKVARDANKRFRKAELLEDAFTKATDQTASAGSGGNIANKYKQAVTSIINSEKKSQFFSKEEIDIMRQFVRGDLPGDIMRKIGKLSPNGNGLMQALNLAAVAVDPMMIGASAAATGAKAAADRRVMRGAEDVQHFIATGSRAPTSKVGIPGGAGRGAGIAGSDYSD